MSYFISHILCIDYASTFYSNNQNEQILSNKQFQVGTCWSHSHLSLPILAHKNINESFFQTCKHYLKITDQSSFNAFIHLQ